MPESAHGPAAAADTAGLDVVADERANALLPVDCQFDDGEIVILLMRPSVLYIPLTCLAWLIAIAFTSVLAAYLARSVAFVPWTDVHAFNVGLVAGALRLGWQALEWYGRVYVLTNRRVIRRLGVLRVAVFQTELRAIQHTSVFVGLRERCFGLGSIGFATAGSDTFEAIWVMVRRPYEVHRTVVEAVGRARKK